jgi:hypothetical protein
MTRLEELKAACDTTRAVADAALVALDDAEHACDYAVDDYCDELKKIYGDDWLKHTYDYRANILPFEENSND